jgi:phage-related protein
MYVVRYYATGTDREPVREYIDAIRDKRERDELVESLEELASAGRMAKGIRLRLLRDELWEIKMKAGRREHRILYVQTDPMTLVLLHAFVKTTQRTPRRHIETALKRASYILGS